MATLTLQTFNYAQPITKSDTVNSPTWPQGGAAAGGRYPDAIWVGGAGIVAAIFPDGSECDFTIATGGTVLPIRCMRVNSTTTTATLLVGLWQM